MYQERGGNASGFQKQGKNEFLGRREQFDISVTLLIRFFMLFSLNINKTRSPQKKTFWLRTFPFYTGEKKTYHV